MFRVALPLAIPAVAAILSTVSIALPAHAQSPSVADRFVQDMLQQKQLLPTDKVWLAPPSGERSARDVAVCDAVGAALAAQGIAVMWDVGMAESVTTGGFQQQLAALKDMGVTQLISFGHADDRGNLTVRLVEVPGGWLRSARNVNLDATGMASPPSTIAVGPTGIIFSDRLVTWNPRHGLGIQYSSLSGSGATYRNWLDNGWGYQVAGIPAISFSDNRTTGFVNLGLQGMAPILKTDRLRLYSLLGIGALYRPNDVRYIYDPGTGVSTDRTGDAWDIGLAPGIGLDFRIYDRFLLTGALGYTFSRQSFAADAPTYAYSPGISLGTIIEW